LFNDLFLAGVFQQASNNLKSWQFTVYCNELFLSPVCRHKFRTDHPQINDDRFDILEFRIAVKSIQ